MEEINKTVCCKCHGLGSITNIGSMQNGENRLGEMVTCEICNGLGHTNNLFSVEFLFDNNNTHKTFWLPILILADDRYNAAIIATQTEKNLNAYFHLISQTYPMNILSKHLSFREHFQKYFSPNRRYETILVNLNSRSIKELASKPTLRFNEKLKLRPTNTTILPHTIEYITQNNIYPIRVMNGDSSFDPAEHLVIMCQKRLDLKRIFKSNLYNKN